MASDKKLDNRIDVRKRDACHWEAQTRLALRILSLMELINQTLRQGSHAVGPVAFDDLCTTSVKCVKDLVKIVTGLFTNLIQLRRDAVLQRLPLTADQSYELRHADMVTEQYLFPKELIREINLRHLQDLQNSALREKYTTPSRKNYGGSGAFKDQKQRHKPASHTATTAKPTMTSTAKPQTSVFPAGAARKHR